MHCDSLDLPCYCRDQVLMMMVIMANVICLSMHHYGITPKLQHDLELVRGDVYIYAIYREAIYRPYMYIYRPRHTTGAPCA